MLSLRSGNVLKERYEIQRIIGQGGMGNVYLTNDMRLKGRLCAVKEVFHDPNMSDDALEQARDQFQREATVLARLDHPNLPKVSDYFSEDERDYLVMDFVPGKDLSAIMTEARIKNQFLKEEDVLAWVEQIIDAIGYLHKQEPPIVHRDIKPSNLKLTPDGVIKLVDFGLVKILASEDITITVVQGRGTALYTPLEQYGGDAGHTDGRSDIYALGATMYHLLTNHPPEEARDRFLNPNNLLPPREINPELSSRTERAVLWAMALHPDERPQNIEIYRQALYGDWHTITRPRSRLNRRIDYSFLDRPFERVLFVVMIVLLFISFLITII